MERVTLNLRIINIIFKSYCTCFLVFDSTREEGCHSHSEAKMARSVLQYKIKLFHASTHGALETDMLKKIANYHTENG